MNYIYIISIIAITNLLITQKKKDLNMRMMALSWSLLLIMFYTLAICFFNQFMGEQLNFNFFWINILTTQWGPSSFGVDGLSITLIGLALLLNPICMLLTWNSNFSNKKEFYILLFLMVFPMVTFFSVYNMITFYMTFEMTLVPMFMMMGMWGYSQEKMSAAYYFFFYTLIGSLLMLLSMFKLYMIMGTLNYQNLINMELPEYIQYWLFLGFFMSFAVKMPMFPVHMWLPKAHVEAPITGSVLLAGILLKLGGYGFLSFSYPLFPIASEYFSPFIMTLSLMAIMYSSLTTCRQSDVKTLIAYSSVAHMGFVTLAMFTHSSEGILASVVMMIAHGLVSPALFMTTSILYTSHHTRAMSYYSGLTMTMPMFASMTLLFFLANMSFPLTFNFMAEFLSMLAAYKYSKLIGIMSCLGMLLGTIYSFYYYNSVYFGNLSKYIMMSSDVNSIEFNVFMPLLLLTLFLGMHPNSFFNYLSYSSFMNVSL